MRATGSGHPGSPIAQITMSGTVVAAPDRLDAARATFQQYHSLRLTQVLEITLLRTIQRRLREEPFYRRVHRGIGEELCLEPGPTSGLLEFLANDPELLGLISRLTGCGPIGCFEGRVYRMAPEAGHYDSWHDDVGQDRLVAMSINLSEEPYAGGLLQIRRADSSLLLCGIPNVGPGDAILFRITPELVHRVTAVEGAASKTAYAGWFRSQPNYMELRKRAVARSDVGGR